MNKQKEIGAKRPKPRMTRAEEEQMMVDAFGEAPVKCEGQPLPPLSSEHKAMHKKWEKEYETWVERMGSLDSGFYKVKWGNEWTIGEWDAKEKSWLVIGWDVSETTSVTEVGDWIEM